VLILKNLDGGIWQFASTSTGPKGKQLANTPWAALTFYWPALGRQVRVRGAVSVANAEVSAQDYLARSPGARAATLPARQSDPLDSTRERDLALAEATERVTQDPELVAPEWTVYGVRADEVEFWQGDPQRKHIRLSYTRSGAAWARQMLWP
jgi:pyridoxamine 5'-phosphate oxidase